MKMKYASKRRRDQKKRGSGQVQQHTNKEHKHETRGEKNICQRLKLPLNKLENRQLRTNPQSQKHEKKRRPEKNSERVPNTAYKNSQMQKIDTQTSESKRK